MAVYEYKGINTKGRSVRGIVDAESPKAARAKLRKDGLYTSDLYEEKKEAEGLKRRIHRIQSPTLIVWGESDRLVPPSYAEDFRAGIKNSRVVILKEAAHMPMFEKRDEFVSLVTEFLQES